MPDRLWRRSWSCAWEVPRSWREHDLPVRNFGWRTHNEKGIWTNCSLHALTWHRLVQQLDLRLIFGPYTDKAKACTLYAVGIAPLNTFRTCCCWGALLRNFHDRDKLRDGGRDRLARHIIAMEEFRRISFMRSLLLAHRAYFFRASPLLPNEMQNFRANDAALQNHVRRF